MGDAVADLPAATLIVESGQVDLGQGTDIVKAERVYAGETFDPDLDVLSAQSATQYLDRPTTPVGTKVTGLAAPDGRPLVVVYRDSKGGLQCTPWENGLQVWTDVGLAADVSYYYRIVAVRVGADARGDVLLHSSASEIARMRVIDTTPLEPPVWESAEWFTRLAPEGDQLVIRLRWLTQSQDLEQLVERSSEPSTFWQSVTKSFEALSSTGFTDEGLWTYELVDDKVFPNTYYKYRLKVRRGRGRLSTSSVCGVIPPPS
jgi:hypothetical protein